MRRDPRERLRAPEPRAGPSAAAPRALQDPTATRGTRGRAMSAALRRGRRASRSGRSSRRARRRRRTRSSRSTSATARSPSRRIATPRCAPRRGSRAVGVGEGSAGLLAAPDAARGAGARRGARAPRRGAEPDPALPARARGRLHRAPERRAAAGGAAGFRGFDHAAMARGLAAEMPGLGVLVVDGRAAGGRPRGPAAASRRRRASRGGARALDLLQLGHHADPKGARHTDAALGARRPRTGGAPSSCAPRTATRSSSR